MVISANDFAFFDLCHDTLYAQTSSDHIADSILFLTSDMVKFQNHNVCFSTVYARMFQQIKRYGFSGYFGCFLMPLMV